jgi:hypothetical protein
MGWKVPGIVVVLSPMVFGDHVGLAKASQQVFKRQFETC